MSYKLSYEKSKKGKPIAYLKKDGEYKIIYLNDVKDEQEEEQKEDSENEQYSESEEEEEINKDKACLKCQQGGCLKCCGNCKNKKNQCFKSCK